MAHLDNTLSNPRSILNNLAFFAPRQSGYETYLRSRLIGMTLPLNDPDSNLVEWLLTNMKERKQHSNAMPKVGKDTKKNEELLDRSLDDANPMTRNRLKREDDFRILLTDGVHPMSRNSLKRDDDGRGIGFHQCYWNPVSCFR